MHIVAGDLHNVHRTTYVSRCGKDHPLYCFAGDTKPGDITGQDLNQFGARWHVMTRHGTEVTNG